MIYLTLIGTAIYIFGGLCYARQAWLYCKSHSVPTLEAILLIEIGLAFWPALFVWDIHNELRARRGGL